MTDKIEKDLIYTAIHGTEDEKHKALNKLCVIYRPKLLNLIKYKIKDSFAAEDIAQATLLRIVTGIHNFRFDCDFYSWTYRIAMNEIIYYSNKEKKRQYLPIEVFNDTLAMRTNFKTNEVENKILTCIECLPPKQAKIFKLWCDGLSYEEISKQINMIVPTVKANMSHAKQKTIAAINRGYFIYQESPKHPKKCHLI